jgi:transmembrane sensor
VTVSAGERVLLSDSEVETETMQPEEVEVRLSWRGGNLIFRGEPLSEALSEVERYTPVEFIIVDENLKKTRIAGVFKAGDVDGLLATLQQNFNIVYRRVGDEKVILATGSLPQ